MPRLISSLTILLAVGLAGCGRFQIGGGNETDSQTIEAVKAKLESLKAGLPPGVEIVPTYDRSNLIKRAVSNLGEKLIEEFIIVTVVCALFLFHLRSALVGLPWEGLTLSDGEPAIPTVLLPTALDH